MSLSHWQRWSPDLAWRLGLILGFGIPGWVAIAPPLQAQVDTAVPVTQPFNQSLSSLNQANPAQPAPATQSNTSAANPATHPLLPDEYTLIYVHPTQGNDQATGTAQAPVRSLTQALRLAQPNTVIVLAPGVYSEANGEVFPIQLKPGVTVQGDASTYGQQTIIHGGGLFVSPTFALQNATILAANYAGLTGVTVTNPQPQGYGIWVESSRAVIMANTFAGSQLDGMAIAGHDRSVVRQNIFTQNQASGVSVFGTAATELRNNVFQNTGFGVNIAAESTPTLIGNRILQNRDGVVVQANARPILRTNVIAGNQRDGLTVIQAGQPDLGTSDQAGGNIFQANQRLDINADRTAYTIPAFGNQFTAQRVAGRIDPTGATAIATPVLTAATPATPTQSPTAASPARSATATTPEFHIGAVIATTPATTSSTTTSTTAAAAPTAAPATSVTTPSTDSAPTPATTTAPVVEMPVVETSNPVAATPVAATPVVATPVAATPVAATPVVETPVVETAAPDPTIATSTPNPPGVAPEVQPADPEPDVIATDPAPAADLTVAIAPPSVNTATPTNTATSTAAVPAIATPTPTTQPEAVTNAIPMVEPSLPTVTEPTATVAEVAEVEEPAAATVTITTTATLPPVNVSPSATPENTTGNAAPTAPPRTVAVIDNREPAAPGAAANAAATETATTTATTVAIAPRAAATTTDSIPQLTPQTFTPPNIESEPELESTSAESTSTTPSTATNSSPGDESTADARRDRLAAFRQSRVNPPTTTPAVAAASNENPDVPADLTEAIDPSTAIAIAVEAPRTTPATTQPAVVTPNSRAGERITVASTGDASNTNSPTTRLAQANTRPAELLAIARPTSPGAQAVAIDIPVPPPEQVDAAGTQNVAYLDVGSADRLPVPGMTIPLARGEVPSVNVPINAAWNPNEPPPPPTRSTILGLRYRVIVAAISPNEQSQVRSIAPDAFAVQYNGDMVMQAGAYRDRTEADAMVDRLLNTGLHVFVLDGRN